MSERDSVISRILESVRQCGGTGMWITCATLVSLGIFSSTIALKRLFSIHEGGVDTLFSYSVGGVWNPELTSFPQCRSIDDFSGLPVAVQDAFRQIHRTRPSALRQRSSTEAADHEDDQFTLDGTRPTTRQRLSTETDSDAVGNLAFNNINFGNWWGLNLNTWPITSRTFLPVADHTLSWLMCAAMAEAFHGVNFRFPYVGEAFFLVVPFAAWQQVVADILAIRESNFDAVPPFPQMLHWSDADQHFFFDNIWTIDSTHYFNLFEPLALGGHINPAKLTVQFSISERVRNANPPQNQPRRSNRIQQRQYIEEFRASVGNLIARSDATVRSDNGIGNSLNVNDIREATTSNHLNRTQSRPELSGQRSAQYSNPRNHIDPELRNSFFNTIYDPSIPINDVLRHSAVQWVQRQWSGVLNGFHLLSCTNCKTTWRSNIPRPVDLSEPQICTSCRAYPWPASAGKPSRDGSFLDLIHGNRNDILKSSKSYGFRFCEENETIPELIRVYLGLSQITIPVSPINPQQTLFDYASPHELMVTRVYQIVLRITKDEHGAISSHGAMIIFPEQHPALQPLSRLPAPFLSQVHLRLNSTSGNSFNISLRPEVVRALLEFFVAHNPAYARDLVTVDTDRITTIGSLQPLVIDQPSNQTRNDSTPPHQSPSRPVAPAFSDGLTPPNPSSNEHPSTPVVDRPRSPNLILPHTPVPVTPTSTSSTRSSPTASDVASAITAFSSQFYPNYSLNLSPMSVNSLNPEPTSGDVPDDVEEAEHRDAHSMDLLESSSLSSEGFSWTMFEVNSTDTNNRDLGPSDDTTLDSDSDLEPIDDDNQASNVNDGARNVIQPDDVSDVNDDSRNVIPPDNVSTINRDESAFSHHDPELARLANEHNPVPSGVDMELDQFVAPQDYLLEDAAGPNFSTMETFEQVVNPGSSLENPINVNIQYGAPPLHLSTAPNLFLGLCPELFFNKRGVPPAPKRSASESRHTSGQTYQTSMHDSVQHLLKLAIRKDNVLVYPYQTPLFVFVARRILATTSVLSSTVFLANAEFSNMGIEEFLARCVNEPDRMLSVVTRVFQTQVGSDAYWKKVRNWVAAMNTQLKPATIFFTFSFPDHLHYHLLRELGLGDDASAQDRVKASQGAPGVADDLVYHLSSEITRLMFGELFNSSWYFFRGEQQKRSMTHTHGLVRCDLFDLVSEGESIVLSRIAKILFRGAEADLLITNYRKLSPEYIEELRQKIIDKGVESVITQGEQDEWKSIRLHQIFFSAQLEVCRQATTVEEALQMQRAANESYKQSCHPRDPVTAWLQEEEYDITDMAQRCMLRTMVHGHNSRYCLLGGSCRFGFPKPLLEAPVLEVEALRNDYIRAKVKIARNHPDVVETFQLGIALWRSNSHAEIIMDVVCALLYVADYATKREPVEFKLLQQIKDAFTSLQTTGDPTSLSNLDLANRLRSHNSISSVFRDIVRQMVNLRPVTLPEAIRCLLSGSLYETDVKVITIPNYITKVVFNPQAINETSGRGGSDDGDAGRSANRPTRNKLWDTYALRLDHFDSSSSLLSRLCQEIGVDRMRLESMSADTFFRLFHIEKNKVRLVKFIRNGNFSVDNFGQPLEPRIIMFNFHYTRGMPAQSSPEFGKWLECAYYRHFPWDDEPYMTLERRFNHEFSQHPPRETEVQQFLVSHLTELRSMCPLFDESLERRRHEDWAFATANAIQRQEGRSTRTNGSVGPRYQDAADLVREEIPHVERSDIDEFVNIGAPVEVPEVSSLLESLQHELNSRCSQDSTVFMMEPCLQTLDGEGRDEFLRCISSFWNHLTRISRTVSIPRNSLPELDPDQLLAYQMALLPNISLSDVDYERNFLDILVVLGGPGCGKSNVIKHMLATGSAEIITCAPTGTASFNVYGRTAHSLFGLFTKTDLQGESERLLAARMYEKRIIIIDEISMLSRKDLHTIIRRVKKIRSQANFPRLVLFGDFNQLPCVASENITKFLMQRDRRNLKVIFCRVNHRQYLDQDYAQVIQSVANGSVTPVQYNLISQRFVSRCAQEHEAFLRDGVRHIAATNELVDQINLQRILDLTATASPRPPVARTLPWDETEGRCDLFLTPGALVTIETNLSVDHGITNGAMGTVGPIVYFNNTPSVKVHDMWTVPDVVFVRLIDREDVRFLDFLRSSSDRFASPAFDVLRGFVPIIPCKRGPDDFSSLSRARTRTRRMPLRAGWAVTTHKSQGMSFPRILCTLADDERCQGTTLVTLSRVTSLAGLILTDVSMERLVATVNARDRGDLIAFTQFMKHKANESGQVWTQAELASRDLVQNLTLEEVISRSTSRNS